MLLNILYPGEALWLSEQLETPGLIRIMKSNSVHSVFQFLCLKLLWGKCSVHKPDLFKKKNINMYTESQSTCSLLQLILAINNSPKKHMTQLWQTQIFYEFNLLRKMTPNHTSFLIDTDIQYHYLQNILECRFFTVTISEDTVNYDCLYTSND